MLEWLTASTGIVLAKLVLEQVLNLGKSALEDYVKDFFKGCIQNGVTRAKAGVLEQPMAEALGFWIKRFVKELQMNEVPTTSIEHHYRRAIQQFVKDTSVRPLLGKAFETNCKQIDFVQLQQIWAQNYQKPEWQFPTEDFDWRSLAKEYVYEVKGIITANAELRSLLTTTDPFIQQHQHDRRSPRFSALKALLTHYPDHSKTIELLRDRALNDPDEQLREWAQEQLQKLEAQQ